MSAHNIYFYGEIRKVNTFLVEKKSTLSRAMSVYTAYLLSSNSFNIILLSSLDNFISSAIFSFSISSSLTFFHKQSSSLL